MKAGGDFLHTIIIGDEIYEEVKNGRVMVLKFLRACVNVRSLSVVGKDGRWASAFATQLRKLEISSPKPTGAIPRC